MQGRCFQNCGLLHELVRVQRSSDRFVHRGLGRSESLHRLKKRVASIEKARQPVENPIDLVKCVRRIVHRRNVAIMRTLANQVVDVASGHRPVLWTGSLEH
jgi:hypothetical protein